jgi:hypothetical protein
MRIGCMLGRSVIHQLLDTAHLSVRNLVGAAPFSIGNVAGSIRRPPSKSGLTDKSPKLAVRIDASERQECRLHRRSGALRTRRYRMTKLT